MNETTLKDIKHTRKANVIKEAESPAMKKRRENLHKIELRNDEPILNDEDEYEQLYKELRADL